MTAGGEQEWQGASATPELRVELERSAERIRGYVSVGPQQEGVPFEGWLELARAVELAQAGGTTRGVARTGWE